MKGKLLAYLRLFRIEHAIMLSFAVLLSILLAEKLEGVALPSAFVMASALLVPFFIEMASFALNDYLDVKTDCANRRRDRPLVTKELTPCEAKVAAVTCYAFAFFFSLYLPIYAFLIALVFAILSVAYDYRLKDAPLAGNLYIALSMAIPFVFGNLVVSGDSVYLPIFAIALVAFAAGLGREIVKSAEDMEGDRLHRGSRTLPLVIGKHNSVALSIVLYFLLLPLSFSPYYFGVPMNVLALGLTALSAFAFAAIAVSLAKDCSKECLAEARKSSLLALGVGLLGYAAALL